MKISSFFVVNIMSEYFFIVDYVEAFFWTVTYMFIAFVGLVNKDDRRLAMPKVAVLTNFAWEVASIIDMNGTYFAQGSFIRASWLIFDILILLAVFRKNKGLPDFRRNALRWIIPWLAVTVFFTVGFRTHDLFMPISAFIIDIEMAILFWFQRKSFDPSLRLFIAISKLFGDILAGVYCSVIHPSIIVMAVCAACFNIMYLIFAVKELKANPGLNDNFRNNLKEIVEKIKSRRLKKKKQQGRRKYKKKTKNKKTHRKSN